MEPTGFEPFGERLVSASDSQPGSRASKYLLRAGTDDLFWLGTAEAIELGRSQAQLLRRSVRQFSAEPVPTGLVEAAVARVDVDEVAHEVRAAVAHAEDARHPRVVVSGLRDVAVLAVARLLPPDRVRGVRRVGEAGEAG